MAVSIADVRAVAMALPRTTEGLVRGSVRFRIGRIVYIASERDDTMMGFAFPREWRVAAVDSEPEKFAMPTGGDLRHNWLLARMDALDGAEMRELVLDAWAFVVPKRVFDAYVAS